MNREQELLLERLPDFKARTTERLKCTFYGQAGVDNFVMAEQIHTHFAVGEIRTDYTDLMDYWLSSLFNSLEDRFETAAFQECAQQSAWTPVELEDITARTTALFHQIQNSASFVLPDKPSRAFCMIDDEEKIAYLVEMQVGYASFFWHSAIS